MLQIHEYIASSRLLRLIPLIYVSNVDWILNVHWCPMSNTYARIYKGNQMLHNCQLDCSCCFFVRSTDTVIYRLSHVCIVVFSFDPQTQSYIGCPMFAYRRNWMCWNIDVSFSLLICSLHLLMSLKYRRSVTHGRQPKWPNWALFSRNRTNAR